MVRAHSTSWQSGLVERFDTPIGTDRINCRPGDLNCNTFRRSDIDSRTRDEIRANRAAARRMLIKLNRAETFAEVCEALSTGPIQEGYERLQVDVLSSTRFRQLRERYERLSGGITVEQRHEIRARLEQTARTGYTTLDDILSSVRSSHRKWSSPSDLPES